MNEQQLKELIAYLEAHTGLRSPSSNTPQLRRAVDRLANQHGISAGDVVTRLPRSPELREQLINFTMIGETYFFREAAHFTALNRLLSTDVLAQTSHLTCWSVSCSTGEEAVSLAALMDEARRQGKVDTFTIYATDINSDALGQLRRGVFSRSSLRRDGGEFHSLLDRHITASDSTSITIDSQLLEHLKIHRLNFFLDPLSVIPDHLDLIVFRNTLLYARHPQRAAILNRIVPKLRDRGYLFPAVSELPFINHQQLEVESFERIYFLQRRQVVRRADISKPAQTAAAKADTSAAPRTAAAPPVERRRRRTRQPAAALKAATADGAVTTQEVLALLNQAAPGETLPERGRSDDPTEMVARMIYDCFSAINAGQWEEAATLVEELWLTAGSTAAALYCCGWFHRAADNLNAAIEAFDRCLQLDGSFWPARFHRTLMQLQETPPLTSEPQARQDFSACIAAINRSQRTEHHRPKRRAPAREGVDAPPPANTGFAFFLEDFSPAYFRRICERWVEKLTENSPEEAL